MNPVLLYVYTFRGLSSRAYSGCRGTTNWDDGEVRQYVGQQKKRKREAEKVMISREGGREASREGGRERERERLDTDVSISSKQDRE
jgi:hypothetical protein